MSAEIERLVADAKLQPGLRQELAAASDNEALAARAQAHGYAVSAEEIETYVTARRALTDQQLNEVAVGGGAQIKVQLQNGSTETPDLVVFQKDAPPSHYSAWQSLFGNVGNG